MISRSGFDSIKDSIAKRLKAFHVRDPLAAGLSLETLRKTSLAGMAGSISDAAFGELTSEKVIAIDGDIVHLAKRKQRLKPDEASVKDELERVLGEAKLEPPKISEVLSRIQTLDSGITRRIFQMLLDDKTVTKVSDEFYFSTAALRKLQLRVKAFADRSPGRSIDVAQFKDLDGVSRKYAIPLLEYVER